jgi:hypothetical protein
METLTPTERPVFVLREVFALDYDEIDTVVAVRVDDGLITGFSFVRSPEKLSRVEQETALSR